MRDIERHKQRKREHYLRNRARKIEQAKEARKRNKMWLDELKTQPCQDCNLSWPPFVMEFHHRDKMEKSAGVAWLIYNASRQRVLDEIAKCDLVCSNCHKIREYGFTP